MPELATASRGRRGGFTLFEILGAVTILAVVYTWLATSAMQGMRSEGLSKRRLEASLLIDEEWMQLETELASGLTPPVGSSEEELEEPFRLRIDVVPFDPTPWLGEEFPPEGATTTLLLPPERPELAFLRLIDLRVLWEEGGHEFEVRRTTLAYDAEQLGEFAPEDGADAGEPGDDAPSGLEEFQNPDGSTNLEGVLEKLREIAQ